MTQHLPILPAALLVAAALSACQPEKRPPPASFFFAHHIDDAAAEFDDAQFRSFRKDGTLVTTVTLGDLQEISESRLALIPPLPSRLSYRVVVPEGGRLDFEVGVQVLGEENLPAPVVFAIDVDGESVFEETIRRRFGNQWLRRHVDLETYGGREVVITFATRFSETPFIDSTGIAGIAEEGLSILPAWGHPVLGGSSATDRPDLILISIDCLRADHVGVYGHTRPTTPNIDALAGDAAVFENTVSVSSWTLPTHMSMLTGLMPTEHGLTRSRKRGPDVPYLPEILSRDGYETIGVVSGLYLSPTFGYEQGFDVYRALIDEPAETLVDAARELFFSEPRRPRFLFLHFFDAHWPYLPRDEYLEQVGGRPKEVSDLLKNVINRRRPADAGQTEDTKTLYDAEVAYVDAHLGRFFDELEQSGRYDDALIVITADHGEGFYEHELWQHSEIIYNEVTRVPLIVKGPRGAGARRVSELVSQLGIFPTFLEALELETPFDHPGLLSLSEDGARFPASIMSEIIWEANESRGPFVKLAATRGELKYIATFSGELDDEQFVSTLVKEELYDLSRDPGERSNLLPDGANRIGELRSQVRDYLDVVRARRAGGGGDRIVVDDELAEKLRALGYVQ
jgi:arylsulfatase A-like enzyme